MMRKSEKIVREIERLCSRNFTGYIAFSFCAGNLVHKVNTVFDLIKSQSKDKLKLSEQEKIFISDIISKMTENKETNIEVQFNFEYGRIIPTKIFVKQGSKIEK